MNSQPNLYGDKNVHFSVFQYDIIDDVSKIKPTLDALRNIDRTDMDGPFLDNLNHVPEENLLGQNLDGNDSPIAKQINDLNNAPKINKNIIVMVAEDEESVKNLETVEKKDLAENELVALEKKLKDLERLNTSKVSNSPVPTEAVAVEEVAVEVGDEAEVAVEEVGDEVGDAVEEVADETVTNKAFRDMYHTTITNKIVMILFLIIMGIIFAVYHKEIKKMLK